MLLFSVEHLVSVMDAVALQVPQDVMNAGWITDARAVINSAYYTAPEAMHIRYIEFAQVCSEYFDHEAPYASAARTIIKNSFTAVQ